MPAPILPATTDGDLYDPFSGQPLVSEDGDPSENLLFAFYGNAGEFGHVSDRLRDHLEAQGHDPNDFDPHTLADVIHLPGAVVWEVDAGWNGVNYFAVAPPTAKAPTLSYQAFKPGTTGELVPTGTTKVFTPETPVTDPYEAFASKLAGEGYQLEEVDAPPHWRAGRLYAADRNLEDGTATAFLVWVAA